MTPPHHHKNTTPPQKQHHKKTAPQKHHHTNTTTKTPPQHHKNTTTPPHQHHHIHFTAVFHRSPVQSSQLKQFFTVSPQFFTVVRFSPVKNVHFTTVLNVRHVRSDERVARPDPEFWHFTSVLGVRHVRSDESVARRAQKFAFYHSFERPTRPK